MALKTKYSPLRKLSWDNLFNTFLAMNPKRQLGTAALVMGVLLFILFLPVFFISAKVSSLKKEVETGRKGYRQIVGKIAEYDKVRKEVSALDSMFGGAGGPVPTRLEVLSKRIGVNIGDIGREKLQETDFLDVRAYDVKVGGVTLAQLTELLFHIENDPGAPMRVRRLQIKPRRNGRQFLDVNFEVATFQVKKEI